jgi:hypothetical protein
MAQHPEAAGPSDQPPSGADGPRADSAREHLGIVAIERHLKDDGRSLILYSRERAARDE